MAESTTIPTTDAKRTFRLACPQQDRQLALDLLHAEGYRFAPEPFSDVAYHLTEEPQPLGGSLANTFGLIYIQDKSSMLPPLYLDPAPGSAILDMCASPGGKTSLLSLLVGPEGFVIGNEPNRSRLETLRRNLHRMNAVNAATCSFPGEELPLPPGSFDAILLDPPCSGWGTVNKNPNVMQMWSEDKTEPLERLQRELLRTAVDLLKPGGRLMYSTCTTNARENETQADFAISELGLTLDPLPHPPGFQVDAPTMAHLEGVLRVGGGQEGGQGFFLARFVKPEGDGDDGAPVQGGKSDFPGRPLSRAERDLCAQAGADLAGLPPGEVYRFGENTYFLHEHALRIIPREMRWQGFPVGKFAGKKFKPDARLRALLPGESQRFVDASSIDVIRQLLSGQSLTAPQSGKWAGLSFHGHPLARLAVKGKRVLWSDR